ncbi:hypothetical protein [Cylindrospermopsis raciborskii]
MVKLPLVKVESIALVSRLYSDYIAQQLLAYNIDLRIGGTRV